MTSMKSVELAGLGTNHSAKGQETMSFSQQTNDPRLQPHQHGRGSKPSGLIGALSTLFERIEISLERSRTLSELERLDDRMLSDIGLTRTKLREKVQSVPVRSRPSLLRRMGRSLRQSWTKRATVRQLRSLPDALLGDIGIERGQIEDAVTALLAAREAEKPQPVSGRRSPTIAELLILPLRQWNISRHAASEMVRIDPTLLHDIGYVKGDVDWVPEVLAERRLKAANLNRGQSHAA
jgi:uncharacterized protein YjiS (DUF1127 family)